MVECLNACVGSAASVLEAFEECAYSFEKYLTYQLVAGRLVGRLRNVEKPISGIQYYSGYESVHDDEILTFEYDPAIFRQHATKSHC